MTPEQIELAKQAGFADGPKAMLMCTVFELETYTRLVREAYRVELLAGSGEPAGHFLRNYGEEGLWLCCKAEIKGMTEPLYDADQLAAAVLKARREALEDAAKYCHDASIPQPDQTHTDAQWAAVCLAVNIRNMKDNT